MSLLQQFDSYNAVVAPLPLISVALPPTAALGDELVAHFCMTNPRARLVTYAGGWNFVSDTIEAGQRKITLRSVVGGDFMRSAPVYVLVDKNPGDTEARCFVLGGANG